MAVRPVLKKLKPTEVVRIMNSTDYGTVLSSSQVYRHFEQGGFRIASSDDERCINLGKYCLLVVGNGLCINELSPDGAVIEGDILSVEYCGA